MGRRETITKDYLLETAFELAKEEGIENVTARKLSNKAGCSTQPIFRLYTNMDELLSEVFGKAMAYFDEYYSCCRSVNELPFVNLGYYYIKFAIDNPELFKILFLGTNRFGRSMYEILNGTKGIVVTEMNKAKQIGCSHPEDLFTKMWIFIHGAACMSITGDYDLDNDATLVLLVNTYNSFK